MKVDFLWQNAVWLIVGIAATRVWSYVKTRLRHRHVRAVFGKDALGPAGISVTLPILSPLTSNYFDPSSARTVALKTSRKGVTTPWPIYGRVMHLDDYAAAEEIFALLREQGAARYTLLPDSDSLGRWRTSPCMICLGSPFVNATFAELVNLTIDTGEPLITADRASDTLDSYRVRLRGPHPMMLGVDDQRAIGVIARLPNPAMHKDAIVGVWGCRSESTLTAARYFRSEFRALARRVEPDRPLVTLLAIRGEGLDVADLMFAATDRVLLQDDDLLRWYLRESTPAGPTDADPASIGPAPK